MTATISGDAFTPGREDVEEVHYGVGLLSCGDDGGDGMIAVGTLDPRRALAAFAWYGRHILGVEARDQLAADLRAGDRVLVPGWAQFARDADDWWWANPATAVAPGAVPVVWLLDAINHIALDAAVSAEALWTCGFCGAENSSSFIRCGFCSTDPRDVG